MGGRRRWVARRGLAIAGVAVLSGSVATAAGAAGPLPGVPHPVRGEAAIRAIGVELPEVAARHGWTAAKVVHELRHDEHLWFDGDALVYVDPVAPAEAPAASGGATAETAALEDTFRLHSRPGGSRVIYLDFDGHTTSGTSWNSRYGDPIVSAPFDLDGVPATFGATELERVQGIWARVADDYAPFDVDVTTEDPGVEALRKSTSSDQAYGVRVVISPTSAWYPNAGGVAYVGSFNWSTDTPCFVFPNMLGNGNEKYVAEAASHEAGHTVGLSHDGTTTGTTYYSGHNQWAPIMGVGYYRPISHWSKGEYANANNTQDDVVVMGGYGVAFRSDDVGSTRITARPLAVVAGAVADQGRIEERTDVDVFAFSANGSVALTVAPAAPKEPDLDVKAQLLDAAGTVVASSDPAGVAAAVLEVTVPAGTYYLEVDGGGAGDPGVDGYSDYGSLGEYRITGTIAGDEPPPPPPPPPPPDPQPPVAVASATPTAGTVPLTVAFTGSASSDPEGGALTYRWDFGDGSAPSAEANPSHVYTSTGVYTASLTVTDPTGLSASASVTITVRTTARQVRIASLTIGVAGSNVTSTVLVTAADGSPVAGAAVSGSWSGAIKGGVSATTGADGRVTFTKKVAKKGTITITVTGVTPVAPDVWDGVRASASTTV